MKTYLLAPRYKVIADYPYNPWLVGEHLVVNEKGELIGKVTGYVDYTYLVTEREAKKYPHIFKKLEWYEERKEDEMPEYVKSNNGIVRRVIKHFAYNGQMYRAEPFNNSFYYYESMPATEAEYLEYQNKQK